MSKIIITSVLFINLILTKGRAAYLVLFGTFFYIFFQDKKNQKLLILGLILISICTILFIPKVRLTITDIFNKTSSSNQERLAIFVPAITQALEKPITGWGDGHAGRKVKNNIKTKHWEKFEVNEYFDPILKQLKSIEEKKNYYKTHQIIAIQRPHNIYLTTLIETGLIGFMAIIYLFYTLINLTNKYFFMKLKDFELKVYFLSLSGSFASIALYGLLHDSLNSRPYAILLWVLISMTCMLINLSQKTKQINKK
ncbi:MAG: O-antigen ligase family protein [Candidatus Margulisbacteria bacterium]|nr:O-antigen ligase family protein [Candidatus Margulisiibacteriota bacterium]